MMTKQTPDEGENEQQRVPVTQHTSSMVSWSDSSSDDEGEDRIKETSIINESLPVLPPKNIVATTATLCLCMLTHSYLLISVFPYSGFMAVAFLVSVDEDNAGKYAGLIASSFMVGRAFMSMVWGRAADQHGRVFCLCLSLLLSSFFSALFGLSTSFPMALLIRFSLGCSNGIMTVIKTLVSELCKGNEALESRMMSLVIGMWGWGFLVSPVISGALAEPVRQYPTAEWLQEGKAGDLLRRYPFLPPNVLGVCLCLLSVSLTRSFVQETRPRQNSSSVSFLDRCRMCARGNKKYEPLPFRGVKGHHSDRSLSLEEEEDYDFVLHEGNTRTVSASRIHASDQPTVASILARPETRKCLSIQWMYSFVSLTVDETFPLFCLSQTAGFGLSELSIGRILSLCGLIFAFCQYWVNALIYNRFGLYGSIRIASLLSGPIMFLAPLSVLLNLGAGSGELHKGTFLFLALMMATYRIFTLVFFSNISVATNRTVPASERATMNGISVLGGSAAKALGPTFAGILVSSSVYWLGRFASLLIFGTIGLLGLFVSVLAFFFLRMDEDSLRIASTTEIIDLEEPCTIELPGGPHKQ